MKYYGIADIGSNTIVLIVYHFENGRPVQDKYISTPVHLIQYVDEKRHMSEEGIQAAQKVLLWYESVCQSMNCTWKWADITEPCRITNVDELFSALQMTGFAIYPLSGEEEAACDFMGSRLSHPEITEGAAFDVGGGSTELIVFKDSKPLAAASFPLGCVRLSKLSLDNPDCRREIRKIQEAYPALQTTSRVLIGIGGTARAAGQLMNALYGTGKTIDTARLKEVYSRLLNKDPAVTEAMRANVEASRQPVFLPGLHMILEIIDTYAAETIALSDAGIREGFLLTRIAELEEEL